MIKIQIDDHRGKLHGANKKVIRYIRKYLRRENDYWLRRNSKGKVPKYKYYLTKKGSFLTGFLPRIVFLLKKAGIDYKIQDGRKIKKMPEMSRVRTKVKSMRIGGNELKLRDYQLDALIKGLQRPRGILDMATGAGKTVVMGALALAWWKTPTLIVINSKDLAYQLRDELSEYMGQNVGFIGDGILDPQEFTVGIDKSILTNSSSKYQKMQDFCEDVQYLIFDEVHHLQSRSWRDISLMCPNASIRHGYSGTPETSTHKKEDGSEGNRDQLLEGYLGPTIYTISANDLIERGWLAKPYVKIIDNDVYFDGEPLTYLNEYKRIIAEDETRNDVIARIATKAVDENKQVIGFINRLSHGDRLVDIMRTDYSLPADAVSFVNGSSYDRESEIEAFAKGHLPILLGTVLSEGLNFFCDIGINCAAGKSPIDVKQRIGRVLRKTKTETGEVDKSSDESVKFVDFKDAGHVWFEKHARRRINTYKAEGHEVEFVDADSFLEKEL